MKVLMTEYLRIDLDKETWECRVCDHEIGPATTNYKEGMLVYDRNPRDVHPPVIDPERAMREIDALGLRPETLPKLLRDNALRVFTRLPAPKC